MNVYEFIPHKNYTGHIIVAAHNALEAVKIISTVPLFERIYVSDNCTWEKIEGLEYNKEPCILSDIIIDTRKSFRY